MKLIVQPGAGLPPLLSAVRSAKSRIELIIFRFDSKEIQKALEQAVARGVHVHALIAHTNRGGDKSLRKLELALLEAGCMVSRTSNDLIRYHGKMMIVDRATLYMLGFNYTQLDIARSRSIGLIVKQSRLVQAAVKLFEADVTRQSYLPECNSLVVSPENSRLHLSALIKGAKRQLLIYDPKVSDRQMVRLLQERVKAGVDVRILGKVGDKVSGLKVEKLPKIRLHVRAVVRDGRDLFVGSQSLRGLELDKRREVGVLVRDRQVAGHVVRLFEEDWSNTEIFKEEKRAAENVDKDKVDKDKKDEKPDVKAEKGREAPVVVTA